MQEIFDQVPLEEFDKLVQELVKQGKKKEAGELETLLADYKIRKRLPL